jgi:hypothetical protein
MQSPDVPLQSALSDSLCSGSSLALQSFAFSGCLRPDLGMENGPNSRTKGPWRTLIVLRESLGECVLDYEKRVKVQLHRHDWILSTLE